MFICFFFFFFFQAEDGIRDDLVTGVQTCALPISVRSPSHPHAGIVSEEHPVSEQNSTNAMNGSNGNKVAVDIDLDREVIRCKTCGLVQYRTRTGNCRRCLRCLPPKVEFLIPPPEPQEL